MSLGSSSTSPSSPTANSDFCRSATSGLMQLGLLEQQVVGSLVRDIIPSPSREMALNHYRQAILTGQTVRWEAMSVYPAGSRYGEVAVTPLYDAKALRPT